MNGLQFLALAIACAYLFHYFNKQRIRAMSTEKPLSELMDFDHVIRVNPDGSITDSPDSPYFEISTYRGDDDEWHTDFQLPDGWELLTGYTGQWGYTGPVMHSSEFIGGRMERDIRDMPGDYVALVVETDCGLTEFFCAENGECACEPDGWVIAHKPLEEKSC